MVHMAHDGDHRRPFNHLTFILLAFFDMKQGFFFKRCSFNFKLKFSRNQNSRIKIDGLIHGCHDTQGH